MRVPWRDIGSGRLAPLLTAGFRRHGKMMTVNPLMLVDTGADGTVLPVYNAKLLGFKASDLVAEECVVAAGRITVHRPRDLRGTEIEMLERWLPLPSLAF